MADIIYAVICFVIAIGALIISICSFREKGHLLNNAWIFASKQERGRMNKKPYYRQSAVVFLLIAVMSLLNGVGVLFDVEWVFYVTLAVAAVSMIYAVVSGIKIEKM